MTLRVAALTTGLRTPSSRFRVRQHIEPLAAHGILVREFRPLIDDRASEALAHVHPKRVRIRHFPPAYPLYLAALVSRVASHLPGMLASWRYDVTWLSRGLCEGWPTLESRLGRPLVLDVDDAIWLTEPFGRRQASLAAQRADVVVVCNHYLAEWFAQYCGRIELVPTTVDERVFFPTTRPDNGSYVIGWTGVSANFTQLETISTALGKFFRHASDARLRVVADAPPPELGLPPGTVDFVPWSELDEAAALQGMDVGIMPLVDNAWARGKCAFKLIQYMACGLPIVASPTGMNTEALGCSGIGLMATSEDQWLDALVYLYAHRDEARRLGALGRERFLDRFTRSAATDQLARIFKSLAR